MLEVLRKNAGGMVAKVLMGLLILSFAIWGIGDIFRGFGERDLAVVGDQKINVEEFRQLYQERLQQVSRQMGRGLTPDQARAIGMDRQLLGELISERTLDERARKLGLNISDQELIARIHANPAFRGPTGQFDQGRFYETLRSVGFTETRFIDAERRLALRQQLGRSLGAETPAPAILREALRRFENEERSVEFVRLGREQAGDIPAPTPAEIETYFNERKAAFRAPEYRKLVLLPLTAESMAANVKITDEELTKTYEAVRDRLGSPERRDVDQIIFQNSGEAEAAVKRLKDGAKFDEIVTERGLKPADVSLGMVAKREILDPGVAEAVFGLEPGGVTAPVAGRFGTVIARVNKIEPGKQPTFDEIKEDLRKDVAQRRATGSIHDQHDKVEDERAGGAHLTEVGAKLGMKPVTIEAVDRSGRGPDGKPIEGVPGLSEVLDEAFSTDVGYDADPVQVGNGSGYVWFEVVQVTPSRDHTLDEVRDRVEARWRDDEVGKRLAERAEAIEKKLDAGETFAAAAPGLAVQKREKVRRTTNVEGLDRSALAGIFQTQQGQAGVVNVPESVDRIVYRITAVDTPASDASAQRVADLNLGVQDDILVQYVLDLQSKLGVRVNETAFRNATGASTGN
jgi:peptidyl-prolyl cis-trans isomerase D